MKPKSKLRLFLAAIGSALLTTTLHAETYYWDSNNSTPGFGSANGTWADPTLGTATAGSDILTRRENG